MPLMEGAEVNVAYVAGVIDQEEKDRFKKLMFRATRGKALTTFRDFEDYEDDSKKKTRKKTVYIVVFQEGQQLRDRILRICDSFMGQRFDLPALELMGEKVGEVERQISEGQGLIDTSRNQLRSYLKDINQIGSGNLQNGLSQVSALEVYKWIVAQEKSLYHALNNMRSGQKIYIGFFWVPVSQSN